MITAKSKYSGSNGQVLRLWRIGDATCQGSVLPRLPIHAKLRLIRPVIRWLLVEKISQRYFFETDMLFRLNTLGTVVIDVPMHARYGDEKSSLSISGVIGEFLVEHVRNFFKRLFYNYYLRDMSLASIELPLGVGLLGFGLIFGVYHLILLSAAGTAASAGTVMLSALPILLGMQLILAFIGHDVRAVPTRPLHLQARVHFANSR